MFVANQVISIIANGKPSKEFIWSGFDLLEESDKNEISRFVGVDTQQKATPEEHIRVIEKLTL